MMDRELAADGFARALSYALPLFGGRLSGGVTDGYWLDSTRYFFCVVEVDDEGALVDRPKVADAVTGALGPPMSEAAVTAAIVAAGLNASPDLTRARYSMPDTETLVVVLDGRAYHVALPGGSLVKVEPTQPAPSLYSPDGHFAAFLQDHSVWLRDRRTGATRRLTPPGERHHAFGAMQESSVMPLAARMGVPQGLWSPDSQWLAVQRIDERHQAEGGLIEHVPQGGGRAQPHGFKISTPDQELPTVEFAAFHVADGRCTASSRMPACSPYGAFLSRECWFAGEHLYWLAWDRFTSDVSLIEMSLADGTMRTVIREAAADGWINVNPVLGEQPLIRVLAGSGELVWYSERDGFGHLHLHDLASGAMRNAITAGGWTVREVIRVDEARRRVVFLASGFADDDDPGRRHLCTVFLDGTGFRRVALGQGDVGARADPALGTDQSSAYRPSYAPGGASPDGRFVVATVGGVDRATRRLLVDLATERHVELARSDVEAIWAAPRPRPFVTVAADGETRLPGALHYPTGFDATRSYPLVVYIYPGPQTGVFERRLPTKAASFLQSVAELGVVGMILEARGLPNRGRAFHQAGGGLMHEPQLADHVAAIEQLCRRHPFIDRARVGIFGSSGGGYATARALFDYPDVFKVGVAAAGMHDSRNYLSFWIDRYGARPGSVGRETQSNVEVAQHLRGHLLLIHGDMDDNVHPAHTLSLVDALIKADRPFDLLIVPGAGHMAILESSYAYRRMLEYFSRHLIDAGISALPSVRWTPAQLATGLRLVASVA